MLFMTNHMTLKPSLRSSFPKIGSKNSLLGKLLKDYILLPLPPPPLTSLTLLMFQIVAQVQEATYYRQKLKYYLLKQLLTVKHEKICCTITWYRINSEGYLNQKLVFQELMPVPSIIVHLKLFYIET